jgi:hypothetical protein
VVEIDKCIAGPEPAAQFVPCDNLARVLEKDGEDLERLFWELESKAVLAQFASLEVHFKYTEMENPRDSGWSAHDS